MDRRQDSLSPPSLRFPRTRGDGPVSASIPARAAPFPPHARGWTELTDRLIPAALVSPARAGMDRPRWNSTDRSGSFPRTRGDGPLNRIAIHRQHRFPPHARGWTLFGLRRLDPGCVSPARAGMDRLPESRASARRGFPRTRGDGPHRMITRAGRALFPPHARGWTDAVSVLRRHASVSPARAGMDHTRTRPERSPCSFPRTRGDGPLDGRALVLVDQFPPHARGWTAHGRRRGVALPVSPARAGMDPSSRATTA